METRPLGDTGHGSSVLTFGAIALDYLDQDDASARPIPIRRSRRPEPVGS